MNADRILQGDERAALALRALYHSYGYTQYKMNKFEEYDLYVQNKDFLISDNVITFTDTSGKLLALKPDVTLSIVKNAGRRGSLEKVYYQENVYRVSGRTHAFREIMQVGLECIGSVDDYCIFEVLTLAAKSLATISENAVLDVSHLGIVSAVLDALTVPADTRRALLRAIGEKNLHEATTIAEGAGVSPALIAVLQTLISSYGTPTQVLPTLLPALADIVPAQTLDDFAALLYGLEASPVGTLVHVDLSVVGDIGYYNGIVFKGFVAGVPEGLLSGGEYTGLMQKMGKQEKAIGFAVYLDALERFMEEKDSFDVDVLVLYDDGVTPTALAAQMAALVSEGKHAVAVREIPERLRYRTLLRLNDGEVLK